MECPNVLVGESFPLQFLLIEHEILRKSTMVQKTKEDWFNGFTLLTTQMKPSLI